MIAGILTLAGVALIAYAIWSNYAATDPTKSVAGRVLAAALAGATAIGVAVASWFKVPAALP